MSFPTFSKNKNNNFRVPDATKCSVTNLRGLTYTDKTQGGKEVEETGEVVRITGFTDRVYLKAPDDCELKGLEGGRALKLTKVSSFI